MKEVKKRVLKTLGHYNQPMRNEQNYLCYNLILQNHEFVKKLKLTNNLQKYPKVIKILVFFYLTLFQIQTNNNHILAPP